MVLRDGIDGAIKAGWLETRPVATRGQRPVFHHHLSSGNSQRHQEALLINGLMKKGEEQTGDYTSSAELDPSNLQDLIDVSPEMIKVAAGVSLQFKLSVTPGDGQEVASETIESLNTLLEEVSHRLRLKA